MSNPSLPSATSIIWLIIKVIVGFSALIFVGQLLIGLVLILIVGSEYGFDATKPPLP